MSYLIWAGQKLTFSREKLCANSGKFFLVKATVKFWNLQLSKILNTDTNRIFPTPFNVMYISLRYSLKTNSVVSRSGYLFGMNKKFSLTNALVFSHTHTHTHTHTQYKCNNRKFSQICFHTKCKFLYINTKSEKKYLLLCLTLFLIFCFFLFLFFQCFFFCHLLCQAIFRWLASFLIIFFFFLGRALCSTWKQILVQMIIFSKELLCKFSGSPTQSTHHETLLNIRIEYFLVNVSRIVCRFF